jgi:hypothetical protein
MVEEYTPYRCTCCRRRLPPPMTRYCPICDRINRFIRKHNIAVRVEVQHLPPAARAEREARIAAYRERVQLELRRRRRRRGRREWV